MLEEDRWNLPQVSMAINAFSVLSLQSTKKSGEPTISMMKVIPWIKYRREEGRCACDFEETVERVYFSLGIFVRVTSGIVILRIAHEVN